MLNYVYIIYTINIKFRFDKLAHKRRIFLAFIYTNQITVFTFTKMAFQNSLSTIFVCIVWAV